MRFCYQGKKGKKSKNVSKEDDESAADAPRRRYKPCPSIFSFFTAATDLANGGKAKVSRIKTRTATRRSSNCLPP
jgi:hypothetical protein